MRNNIFNITSMGRMLFIAPNSFSVKKKIQDNCTLVAFYYDKEKGHIH